MDLLYLTDEIDIILTAADANGAVVTSTQAGIRARVSEKNRLITGRDGKEVIGSAQVIIDHAANVSYESKIKIKKICGVTYSRPNKDWQIHQLSRGHGMSDNFIEVWI